MSCLWSLLSTDSRLLPTSSWPLLLLIQQYRVHTVLSRICFRFRGPLHQLRSSLQNSWFSRFLLELLQWILSQQQKMCDHAWSFRPLLLLVQRILMSEMLQRISIWFKRKMHHTRCSMLNFQWDWKYLSWMLQRIYDWRSRNMCAYYRGWMLNLGQSKLPKLFQGILPFQRALHQDGSFLFRFQLFFIDLLELLPWLCLPQ